MSHVKGFCIQCACGKFEIVADSSYTKCQECAMKGYVNLPGFSINNTSNTMINDSPKSVIVSSSDSKNNMDISPVAISSPKKRKAEDNYIPSRIGKILYKDFCTQMTNKLNEIYSGEYKIKKIHRSGTSGKDIKVTLICLQCEKQETDTIYNFLDDLIECDSSACDIKRLELDTKDKVVILDTDNIKKSKILPTIESDYKTEINNRYKDKFKVLNILKQKDTYFATAKCCKCKNILKSSIFQWLQGNITCAHSKISEEEDENALLLNVDLSKLQIDLDLNDYNQWIKFHDKYPSYSKSIFSKAVAYHKIEKVCSDDFKIVTITQNSANNQHYAVLECKKCGTLSENKPCYKFYLDIYHCEKCEIEAGNSEDSIESFSNVPPSNIVSNSQKLPPSNIVSNSQKSPPSNIVSNSQKSPPSNIPLNQQKSPPSNIVSNSQKSPPSNIPLNQQKSPPSNIPLNPQKLPLSNNPFNVYSNPQKLPASTNLLNNIIIPKIVKPTINPLCSPTANLNLKNTSIVKPSIISQSIVSPIPTQRMSIGLLTPKSPLNRNLDKLINMNLSSLVSTPTIYKSPTPP
jgi:hypothetical protein